MIRLHSLKSPSFKLDNSSIYKHFFLKRLNQFKAENCNYDSKKSNDMWQKRANHVHSVFSVFEWFVEEAGGLFALNDRAEAKVTSVMSA